MDELSQKVWLIIACVVVVAAGTFTYTITKKLLAILITILIVFILVAFILW